MTNRREFMGLLLAAGAFGKAAASDLEPNGLIFRQEEKTGFSTLQGMTDERSAQFTLVLPVRGNHRVEFGRIDGGPALLTIHQEESLRAYSDHKVLRVEVDGLELGVEYTLKVIDGAGRVADDRLFRALDLSRRQVRLGFLSCALDLLHRDDIWRKLDERDPELIFFLGDNVYADRTSFISKKPADERQLWERYVLTRNRVAFYFQRRLRPVLAIWDDHDFGADNSGAEYAHKEAARVAFETFFAQRPRASLVAGPGIARRFEAFGADFFLLDGRTFRAQKMFGTEQESWLFDGIRPRPSWLLNGSLFFGAYTERDSFEGPFASDFRRFNETLKSKDGLYCFASGDVHFSEVMDLERNLFGYETFELVASSIHSYTFPGHENRFANPRRRISTSSHNFVIFEGEFTDDAIRGELAALSSGREDFRTAVGVRR